MQISAKPKIAKICSLLVAGCVFLAYSLLPGVTAQAAATKDYNTFEGLGGENLWHYNGILFEDWTSMRADVEGAVAANGNVALATKGNFSIAANGDTLVMGDYNPAELGYPVALLGADANESISFGPGGLSIFGNVVLRDSAYSTHQAAFSGNKFSLGSLYSTSDTMVDEFFNEARSTANKVVDVFADGGHANVVDGGIFGSWQYNGLNDPTLYEAAHLSTGARSVLVIPVSGEDITLLNMPLSGGFDNYDLIVFYYTEAKKLTVSNGLSLTVDGKVTYSNAGDHRGKETAAQEANTRYTGKLVSVLPQATDVEILGSFVGSMVAPNADVKLGSESQNLSGNLNGMLIANSLAQEANSELHAYWINPFIPDILDEEDEEDPDPDETTTITLAKADATQAGAADPDLLAATFELQYFSEKHDAWRDYYADFPVEGMSSPFNTVANGGPARISLPGLVYETEYRLVETRAPEGYAAPQSVYTYFSTDDDGTVYTEKSDRYSFDGNTNGFTVYNSKPSLVLNLRKVDAEDTTLGLADATFTLYKQGEGGRETVAEGLTSSADGTLSLPTLTAGTYVLEETAAPTGYPLPDGGAEWTIAVTEERGANDVGTTLAAILTGPGGATVQMGSGEYASLYLLENEAEEEEPETGVSFIKRDGETQNPLGGATFNVYKEVFPPETDGDDSGETDALAAGGAALGIRLLNTGEDPESDEPQEPEVGNGGTVDEADEDDPQPEPEPGADEPEATEGDEGEIPAADGVTDGLADDLFGAFGDETETETEEDDSWYDLEYSGRYWQLVAEDVQSDAETGIFYSELNPEDGAVYLIEEIAAPGGYTQPDGDARFTIAPYDGSESYVADIFNALEEPTVPEPDPGIALFYKVDEKTRDGIADAEFQLEMKGTDGEWGVLYPSVKSAGTEGELRLGGLLPGEYRLLETNPPEGYQLDTDYIYFAMGLVDDEIIRIDEGDNQIVNAREEEPEKPEPVTGSISIKKCDFDDNEILLAGTTFQLEIYTGGTGAEPAFAPLAADGDTPAFLYDEENWAAYPDAASNVHITGESGVVVVEGLVAGVYRIEEIIPPNGYDLWGDGIDVIHFVMEEATDDDGNLVLVLAAIYNNHIEVDDEVVFADRVTPVEESSSSSSTPGSTTTSTPGGGATSDEGVSSSGSASASGSSAASSYRTGRTAAGAGARYSPATARGAAGGAKVQTGDSGNTIIWVAAGIIAAVAIATLFIWRRRIHK